MKEFDRNNLLLSMCGLNCGLCSMQIDGYCPGCGGGSGNQSCKIARCSILRHIEYCFECLEYPCNNYDGIDDYDSFITHLHMHHDLQKAKNIGVEAYNSEQIEKIKILKFLLANYNDGRKKTFYCLAVNLLELQDLRYLMGKIETCQDLSSFSLNEQVKYIVDLLQKLANERGIILKKRKYKKIKKRGVIDED